MVSSRSRPLFTKILVTPSFHGAPIITNMPSATDGKRRPAMTSRPGSTVSYARNDALPSFYTPSPAPEVLQTPGLLSHADAMDRFNVSTHLRRQYIRAYHLSDARQGVGGRASTAPHPFSRCVGSRP